jgi:enamine deaminase RidA (YjgF/YER057c/UK114 family)
MVPNLWAARKKKAREVSNPLELPILLDDSKKKKPDKEQVLPLLPDPPLAVTAEVEKLAFYVSPLSDKGLLSRQTEEALRWLIQAARGGTIVKLRAFVAGSGDMRRVQTLVSEIFSERKLPLPALTTVQAGGLPLEGAQVVLEAMAMERKPVNEHGLAWVSGQPGTNQDLVEKLLAAFTSAGLEASQARRVTCFTSTLEKVAEQRARLAAAFPKAALNLVQLQRGMVEDFGECEAVAALSRKPEAEVTYNGSVSGRYSQVALLGPGRIVITGAQLGFGNGEEGIRRAFERLAKALEAHGSDIRRTVFSGIYPLTRQGAEQVRRVRFEFWNRELPPASTLLLFEGLPSLDASMAAELIALAR